MASEADIVNMALQRIGVTAKVTSINPPDNSEAAAKGAFWYPIVRNALLRRAPWPFCRKSVALALIDDTGALFPGWGYAYEYPTDCQNVKAVSTAAGVRTGAYTSSWWWDAPGLNGGIPKIAYEVASNATGTGKVILTDIPSAYLYYFFYQTLTTMFDDLFIDALAWRLAYELVGPMRASAQFAQLTKQESERAYFEALAVALNEEQQGPERESVSISVRNGGG